MDVPEGSSSLSWAAAAAHARLVCRRPRPGCSGARTRLSQAPGSHRECQAEATCTGTSPGLSSARPRVAGAQRGTPQGHMSTCVHVCPHVWPSTPTWGSVHVCARECPQMQAQAHAWHRDACVPTWEHTWVHVCHITCVHTVTCMCMHFTHNQVHCVAHISTCAPCIHTWALLCVHVHMHPHRLMGQRPCMQIAVHAYT